MSIRPNTFVFVVFLLFYGACATPDLEPTKEERKIVDSLYRLELPKLNEKWDSICTRWTDSLLNKKTDSIIEIRKKAIREISQ